MTIKQIETAAVAFGAVALCSGVGAMLVNFWAGAAVIIWACLLILGVGMWIRIRDRRDRPTGGQEPPPLDHWHVVDDELPAELSATEKDMELANRVITEMRWPQAILTPKQRADAEAHSWDKRYHDGLGDL